MSELKITLEEQRQEHLVAVTKKRDDLHVFLAGSRPSVYRFSRRQLLLMVLFCGSVLIVLYAYWDVMILTTLAVNGGQDNRVSSEQLALKLEKEVRVLCWVLTTPKYHKSRAVHIQRTWGKRCNKIYFMTSEPDEELETIILSKPDKYELLWGKTKEAFTYIYENKLDEADWFMKADDDTYVFVENLRHLLYPYSPDMPIYFGFNFKMLNTNQKNASYMSGGSGYVLSREALRLFVHGLNDSSKCRQQDDSPEDVEAGACLFRSGVTAGDSRDLKLRYRFFPMAPFGQLISHYTGMDFWLFTYAYYNPRACMDCLAEYPVAFHYVPPEDLYVFDYLSYNFDLYGRQPVVEYLPEKIAPDQLVIPPSDN
ncbi:glycoprotein-N-acetylgalactosamine 3-beta-galactosyltransferase 1 [Drosophila innubila]|uniref:glycoprotein-N-acetylgalactosamine 3-beta-galactosyltransferase 1 n=1 Tax=Drosophila innubila TaxID=198719 RepID=UPI00148BF697|nr:glycoprotein-N-acetylgalactosamine 3-beta-galactosyltransferase 1 [Drosophila innubila]